METLVKIACLAVVAIVVYLFVRPKAVFVIRIKNARLHIAKGSVPEKFLGDCRSIVVESNIRNGKIRAVNNAGRIALCFSRQIPKSARQQLRNVWSIYV
jgi:hypothetical protein